jgi:hypothetical protein
MFELLLAPFVEHKKIEQKTPKRRGAPIESPIEEKLLKIIEKEEDEADAYSKIVASFLRKMSPKKQRKARMRFEQTMIEIDEENGE